MKNKEQIKLLPKYIKMYKGGTHEPECAMRLLGSFYDSDSVGYFRDAGNWELDCRIDPVSNKIYSVSVYEDMPWLNDVELVPVTYQEWKKDNQGYISKTTKAHDWKRKNVKEDIDLIPY